MNNKNISELPIKIYKSRSTLAVKFNVTIQFNDYFNNIWII